jgi:hypothetical protein
MTRLFFDRVRVDSLRLALGAALDELRAIRNSDYAAVDEMRALAGSCRTLEETWLPRVHDVLNSTAMTSCTRAAPGSPDIAQSAPDVPERAQSDAKYEQMHDDGWEVISDPLAAHGLPAPARPLNGDEVLKAIESGALLPMQPPMDADGRAGAHYESIAFAPSSPPVEIGRVDLTSSIAKVIDFFSDGMPVGWRETSTLIVYRVENVRVTKSVHVLTAYDRDDGPETLIEQTTEARASGYFVKAVQESIGEVTRPIGPIDPTAHQTVASQEISEYSAAFFPDPGTAPVFEALTGEARVLRPDLWTLTQSASPMVDGWGTWDA